MLSACERRLILFYLSNIVPHLRSRDQQAKDLVLWLREHEDQLELPYLLRNDDEAERALGQGLRDQDVPARVWQRVGEASRTALAAARHVHLDRTARRLRRLSSAMRLSRTDTAILELLLRHRTGSLVTLMIDAIGESLHWRRSGFGMNNPLFPRLLGLSAGVVHRRLAPDAPLMTSGLVSMDNDGDVTISDRLTRLHWIPKQAGNEVQGLLLDEAGAGELRWSDFDHVAGDRDHLGRILSGALRTGQKGVNVLVYGPPGTGKTEFCRTLASRLEAPLYVVGESDAAGDEPSRHERIQDLRLAQGLLAGDRRSILLFDEMEDLLSGQGEVLAALLGSRRVSARSAEGSKVFMNRLLEQTPVPILWTSNAARSTSPVLLRRMMFALELRQPPPKVRERIWARQLAQHGIKASPEDACALAREFDVTPGVASGVTAAAGVGGGTVADVRRGVRGLARVLSGDAPPSQRTPDNYDPALIRADMDPAQLAYRLAASGARHFSLCLQGPPGTGKSAYVRYLAGRLGLEVVQKRASDLMSMWVGGTEGNIAESFAEARDAEVFLVFDEADSLLADRRFAQRNWEVSQVNEMLTWMENHPFPFACTTNFAERLDPATLRRFTFKVSLDYLSSEQARAAFRVYFGTEPPAEIAGLRTLTPGDFAVVRRKAEILGLLGDAQALTRMLRAECDAKPAGARRVGFGL